MANAADVLLQQQEQQGWRAEGRGCPSKNDSVFTSRRHGTPTQELACQGGVGACEWPQDVVLRACSR